MGLMYHMSKWREKRGAGTARNTLVKNLEEIWKLDKDKILNNVDSFIKLNDGTPDFDETFKRNDAKFHHDCTSKYSKQKINRIKENQEKQSKSSLSASI